ncbi:MAG: hypothetical protein Q9222_003253 [Ikaeria aurantiellina]
MASQQPTPRQQPPQQSLPQPSTSAASASSQPGRSSPSHSADSEDSQTVVLNTPVSEDSSAETQSKQKPRKQLSRASSVSEPRKCWICFEDETEDSPTSSEWRSPCPCALTAHEACLLDWIADREAPQQNGSTRPQTIECPQCKAEIRIARPRSRVVEWHASVVDKAGRLFWPGIIASLATSMGAACVLHGMSTVYFLLGSHDAELVLGVRNGKMPSGSTIFGLFSIPSLLMLSCTKIGDSLLPVLSILHVAAHRPTRSSGRLWPPSATMALVTLPYIRAAYNGLWRKLFEERVKQWTRQIQPRAGEDGDNANGGAQQQDPPEEEQGGGLNFELGVELEIIEEEEVPEQQPEHAEEVPGNQPNAGNAREEENNNQRRRQDQDEAQNPNGIGQANPNPEHGQDRNPNPIPAALRNDAPRADQNPGALAEQHRVIRLVPLVSAVIHSMMGALAFPAIAAGSGELISLFLPYAWRVPPGRWERRSPGFLQSKFGRSIVGGCLFLVLKDALSLYTKYRVAQDHKQRRVLNYDRTGKKNSTGR